MMSRQNFFLVLILAVVTFVVLMTLIDVWFSSNKTSRHKYETIRQHKQSLRLSPPSSDIVIEDDIGGPESGPIPGIPAYVVNDLIAEEQAATSGFKEMLKKRSSPTGNVIILAYVDVPFIDMALNFYETSLKRLGLTNFLFAASDITCCDRLNKIDRDACYVYRKDEASHKASEYGSKDFLRKMNIRTYMIMEALSIGITVLHTDIDVYFAKNPLEYIECDDCDISALMDDADYNAGFLLIRPTRRSMEVYSKMKALAIRMPFLDDQDQLTQVIDDMSRNYGHGFIVERLPIDRFLCGLIYFEVGERNFVGDNICPNCVVVHNNWMVSREAKIYRFREHLMWDYDSDSYYTSTTRRYLTYDNPVLFGSLKTTEENERNALVNALAIGKILNRTVILPTFHCEYKITSSCAFNSRFLVSSFDKAFDGSYREHVFLRHHKVPQAITKFQSPLYFIESKIEVTSVALMQALPRNIDRLKPRNKIRGATGREIFNWFHDRPDAVLRFHSLYGAFDKFSNDKLQAEFDARIKLGLVGASYRQLPETKLKL